MGVKRVDRSRPTDFETLRSAMRRTIHESRFGSILPDLETAAWRWIPINSSSETISDAMRPRKRLFHFAPLAGVFAALIGVSDFTRDPAFQGLRTLLARNRTRIRPDRRPFGNSPKS